MKSTHDSLLLRVSCLCTHQTVFNKENFYQLVYILACEKRYCYLDNYNARGSVGPVGSQSRLPPLLQILYVDLVAVDLNLTSRVFSGHSGFLPP